MEKQQTKNVTAKMPLDLCERLYNFCIKNYINPSSFIRQAVKKFLDEQEKKGD